MDTTGIPRSCASITTTPKACQALLLYLLCGIDLLCLGAHNVGVLPISPAFCIWARSESQNAGFDPESSKSQNAILTLQQCEA